MIDETAQEDAALFVMGLLPPPELSRFEAQLMRDAELRELVRSLRESAAHLVYAATPVAPPQRLESRILSAARRGPDVRPWPWIPWALAAGFAVAATVALMHVRSIEPAAVARNDEPSKFQAAALAPQGGFGAETVGAVAWDSKQQRGVVTISKLPALEPNQDYQLWVIDPQQKQPISGGIVQVDAEGNAKLVFTTSVPIRNADAFAVSREQKGGAAAPGGPILLMGRAVE